MSELLDGLSLLGALGLALGCWVLFLFVVGRIIRRAERKKWHEGFCPHTGERWQSFDMDSSGAIGYTNGRTGRDMRGFWLSYYRPPEPTR